MVYTEIPVAEHIQLSEDDVRIIKECAEENAINKLVNIFEENFDPNNYRYNHEIICRTTVERIK